VRERSKRHHAKLNLLCGDSEAELVLDGLVIPRDDRAPTVQDRQ
jgi:hypothetical protein